ncbi:MAG: DUF924 domain-containing protein [Candidatus Competibacteraceae bacterium]|nr:DUF924 domain-containing protein [Candidatus Competibacteraceae bacterium]
MTHSEPVAVVAEVLEFWFAEAVKLLWFAATPEFDEALRQRFLATCRAATTGQLEDWERMPLGALALVIVLDQFPLNLFRGQPESFATEAAARAVANRAITRDFDREMSPEQRLFLYLPFMHSEALADQDRSVRLYQQAGLEENLRFAHHHRDLIRRFGRFPHRNTILGRESSPEEVAYLASPEAFLG